MLQGGGVDDQRRAVQREEFKRGIIGVKGVKGQELILEGVGTRVNEICNAS